MENENKAEVESFIKELPPVEFCCVYGSTLHPNNHDKSSMVDFILGVADPMQWHSDNLNLNRIHYASWMVHLGGAKLITEVAEGIGVGVHFNPFVTWNDRMFKYGIVRMHDLIRDVLTWDRFYLSGRLQKPVQILVDNLEIAEVNSVNLKAAVASALLLLPSQFTEVKKIVQGQFDLFQSLYKPFLEEYEKKELLRFSSSGVQGNISQDCGLSAAHLHVSSLGSTIRSRMAMELGDNKMLDESGKVIHQVVINSREEAAKCMQKVLRRVVMVSSARQAVSGLLAVGGVNGTRYLANKIRKAWKSWS
ncbi:phosphatidate cytidylyltransferase, mitochondrial isoform X2 [Tripterygium wilfordii]|uniref:phosphatidate cytidylyltransferase, mitochondrial isoform X2 n=1 Tax=Tripterygium wilfordii TaxID=458696 RepID=UPI0018F83932|nr:phosphatidate cytidylyltransferase, mitochondrial isoform X2 [Tripterygium wilfordii]